MNRRSFIAMFAASAVAPLDPGVPAGWARHVPFDREATLARWTAELAAERSG